LWGIDSAAFLERVGYLILPGGVSLLISRKRPAGSPPACYLRKLRLEKEDPAKLI